MPPHADYHVVLGLVISFLNPPDRASLAAVSRTCRDLVRVPCPCARVSLRLPPTPESTPYAWLATHPTATLVISKRWSYVSTADFLSSLRAVVEAVASNPPRRVEIDCRLVCDVKGVCDLANELLRAGVAELYLNTFGDPPPGAADMCVCDTTTSLELNLDIVDLSLTGTARNLQHLKLFSVHWGSLRVAVSSFPALQTLYLINMRLKDLVPNADAAPHLTHVKLDHRIDLDDIQDLRIPCLARLSIATPCRLPMAISSVRELEVDMWNRRSDEFAFSTLATWPNVHTLVLRNLRQLSSLDDMVSWSVTGLPPSLRCVRAHVRVEMAVDNPRDIQRYFERLMSTYKLQCTCDFV